MSKDVVGRISACLRKIGCRCVLDESMGASWCASKYHRTSAWVVNQIYARS